MKNILKYNFFTMILLMSFISCSKQHKVQKYEVEQELIKYIEAKYSKEHCGMDLTFEGTLDYSCDTDYWRKKVTSSWKLLISNEEIVSTTILNKNIIENDNGLYHIKDYPPININYSKDNFDGFNHFSSEIIYLKFNGNKFKISKKQFRFIQNKRNDVLLVTTRLGMVLEIQ